MESMVVGFVFTEDTEEVLLVKKNKPAWQAGKWNGVGGRIEPGETPEQAVAREIFEETQIALPMKDYNLKITLICAAGTVFFYEIRRVAVLVGHLVPEANDRGEALSWHNIHKLPENIMTNLKWIIPFMYFQELEHPIYIPENMGLYVDQMEKKIPEPPEPPPPPPIRIIKEGQLPKKEDY